MSLMLFPFTSAVPIGNVADNVVAVVSAYDLVAKEEFVNDGM